MWTGLLWGTKEECRVIVTSLVWWLGDALLPTWGFAGKRASFIWEEGRMNKNMERNTLVVYEIFQREYGMRREMKQGKSVKVYQHLRGQMKRKSSYEDDWKQAARIWRLHQVWFEQWWDQENLQRWKFSADLSPLFALLPQVDSRRPWPNASTLILDFPASSTMKKKFLFF